MIAIVDYRAGNVTSVLTAVNHLGYPGKITDKPDEILQAERVIFPGVGAAREAMQNLDDLQLTGTIKSIIADGKPFLGICLGYQILFEESEENDGTQCLGVLPGDVVHFRTVMHAHRQAQAEHKLKVPHMGWNGIAFPSNGADNHPVLNKIPRDSEFYFVHSYYPRPTPQDILLYTEYGGWLASGAYRDNIVALQFHPEKSGRPGLQLLDNFCSWNGAVP